MNKETQKMIDKVEQVTGYKVSVGSGQGFTGHAHMETANPQKPIHSITVNQDYSNVGDFIVTIQCAMILAKWSDPEKIPEFVVQKDKLSHLIDKCLKDKKLVKFPSDVAQKFAEMIVSGLVRQLISHPVQMIAINTVRVECPGLHEMMQAATNNEVNQLHQSLSPKIREVTPEKIFIKNASMNAAFTLNWCNISGQKHLLAPFEVSGFLEKGKELLGYFQSVPESDPQRYPKTVDSWALSLDMATIYKWNYRNETNVS